MVLYLAPLRGVTDYIFRSVYAAHFKGFNCAMAPFITSVRGAAIKPSHIKDVVLQNNRLLPVIPQILSNNAQEFVVLARQLYELGYTTVNWNIGCPFPQVTKKKRGAGLLAHPDIIDAFLDQVTTNIPNILSIKTRLGLLSKKEMHGFLPVFNKYPLAEIVLHPRTAAQMYTGVVDLEGFNEFLAASAHPVMYNGDIVTREFFQKISSLFPAVSSWMIGRGAIMYPLLAQSLRGDDTNTSALPARIKKFHDALVARYRDCMENPGNVLDKMKGVWLYLSHSLPDGKKALKRIQKVKRLDLYEKIVEEIV